MRTQLRTTILLTTLLGGVFSSGIASAQGCDPVEIAKLLADDGQAFDYFGVSVAISGDVALVGAYGDDDRGAGAGAAYVFRWNGLSWVREQKLRAADGQAFDAFGVSVALSGNVAVVGAYRDSDRGAEAGSAYVFRFNGASWVQEQKLLAADGQPFDWFGHSVAVSGNVAVIGADWDDDRGWDSGSAYIFRFNGSSWAPEQKLLAADGQTGDAFGHSVAVSGDVALIGAWGVDDRGIDAGSAYVYRWTGSSWAQEQKLFALDAQVDDVFGLSVALSADLAVIGAPWDDDRGAEAGSAYAFRYNGASWAQEAKLLADDGQPGDYFGQSVAASGDVAVVGAYWDDDRGNFAGSAYAFHWNGASWAPGQKLLASDGQADDEFGVSVAAGGNIALIGAHRDNDLGDWSGSAYVFDLNCNGSPSLSVLGACPGPMRFTVEDVTPLANIAYLYARGEGSFEVPPGNPCSGTALGLNRSVQLAGVERADENGAARLDVNNVPNAACGRIYIQALDLTTCNTSNVALLD